MTRRSPSYEVRLAKYSYRNFEISVPNLRRTEVDPTVSRVNVCITSFILTDMLDLREVDHPDPGACTLVSAREAGQPR